MSEMKERDAARKDLIVEAKKIAEKKNSGLALKRDGLQIVPQTGVLKGERAVCISKPGKVGVGLVKLTMPKEKLPKAAQKYATDAIQTEGCMCWLAFDTPTKIAVSAIKARLAMKKTCKQFVEDKLGKGKKAKCWTKYETAKKDAKTEGKKVVQKKKAASKTKKVIQKAKTKKASKSTKVAPSLAKAAANA